jgi:hypothetical protein
MNLAPPRGSLVGRLALSAAAVLLAACQLAGSRSAVQPVAAAPAGQAADFQEDFGLPDRQLSDSGQSRYFILMPGYQLVLGAGNTRVTSTVLDETREINGVRTRVVESKEEENGQPVEITRNYFAMDKQTGDVFYFGEEVDMYQRGGVIVHAGSWLATGPNKPGLIMPGNPTVGMKYYQEIAPGQAMDRAEIISTSETCTTPAGEFKDCVVTRESSALDAAIEHKAYAPDIGVVQDQSLSLLSYGYVSASR